MFEGRLVLIAVAPAEGAAMKVLPRARLVAGRGIEGDRKFVPEDPAARAAWKSAEVTLIESEAIDALARENGLALRPEDARRNLVTRGVPLNHLVGRRFAVGATVLEGFKLCEPCDYLQSLTKPGVLAGLVHRGGLRARVVRDGFVQAGDSIRPLDEPA